MELAVPVWHSGIIREERIDIERIQNSAAHIILGEEYVSYRLALNHLGLESLLDRREKLCLKFAKKAEKHHKFGSWFKPTVNVRNTRLLKQKYCSAFTRHTRFRKSPLPFLTEVLNEFYRQKWMIYCNSFKVNYSSQDWGYHSLYLYLFWCLCSLLLITWKINLVLLLLLLLGLHKLHLATMGIGTLFYWFLRPPPLISNVGT